MSPQEGHGAHSSEDYFSHKRSTEELPYLKGDDSGYIEGKVFMVWPPRNRLHRVNLEVAEGSTFYRFEVEVPHKNGITFRPHERVSLALKGMKVDRRKESSAPHYFPIILRFPNGVVLKYLSGAHAGEVVNTWDGNTDEWFNPGVAHTVSNVSALDATEICRDPVPDPARRAGGVKIDRLAPPSVAVADGATSAQSTRLTLEHSTERLGRTSASRRKKRRLQKEKQQISSNVATPCQERLRGPTGDSLVDIPNGHSNSHRVSEYNNNEVTVRRNNEIGFLREDSDTITPAARQANVPALELKAGVCTQRGDIFSAINDLHRNPSLANVIGVVTTVFPERRTRTNEWSRSFTLVDPSTVDSSRQNIKVNCFQKKYLEWLPQVEEGDVIILRKLKIVEFNGSVAATGYNDKLRWAVYDPLKHSIRPPNKGNAPEKELIDDGMGYEFCPYWEPFEDSTELEYCRQLEEWWRAKRTLEEKDGSTVVVCSAPVTKQHRLISEVSPDLPPMGFFNCTIEVLQKFSNDSAINIYVTDYTASPLVHPLQTTWCPPELSDRVLQCTMWDNAKKIAKMMNPGEYWYLHNVRARWNPSHYMEGTMQLAENITQLDEANLEAEPHLRALLARKKDFQLSEPDLKLGSVSLHVFPEMLLQDVDGSTSVLTCTVEMLHTDFGSRDGHFIYVTDYTYNPDLPTTVSTADWANNLEHRVLKIRLDDTQAKTLSETTPGCVCTIHNLRIKRIDVSGSMHGCLGGEHTLIVPSHDSSSNHTQTLQQNKEKWERELMLNVLTTPPDESRGDTLGLSGQSSTVSDNATLREVVERPAPGSFKVVARAMDFFPFSLEDACALRCTKCGLSPPSSFKCCPRCDDMIETHSRWFYRLYILLQDDTSNELIVSVSGKECALLQDIDPTNFRCNLDAFRRFLAKFDPVLGNLRDVHAAWSRNEDKIIESPKMIFTLESWSVGDEKGYGLLDCKPA